MPSSSLRIFTLFICITLIPISAWARNLFTNTIGMTFALIPVGTFQMGSPASEKGHQQDEKLHTVTLTKPFYMGTTEVTQTQWFEVMGTTPSAASGCGGDCPVENVSWNDVQEFIRRLNTLEQTQTYRLPTEAEWEYSCRAGSDEAFFNGPIEETTCVPLDSTLNAVGWYCGNSGKEVGAYGSELHPVAQKSPNAFGLYDTHGNVMEWCLDSCENQSRFSHRSGVITDTYKEGVRDPLSRYGSYRVVRNGSFLLSPKYSRSANRSAFRPDVRRIYIGFRLVRML